MIAKLTNKAYQKMMAYVDLCPDEISGLGKVEIEDGEFTVTDVEIFTQVVSPTHSDIPSKALAKFQCELLARGENPKNWFCWWHSHAKMGTFFSGTDTSTIESSTDFAMLLSIVSNHKHEFSARFDLHEPVRMTQTVTVEILEEVDETILNYCMAEIDAKVSRPIIKTFPQRTGFKHLFKSHETVDSPTKDEREDYDAELLELDIELEKASQEKDTELCKLIQDEIYNNKVNGFYTGHEITYPVKKLAW